MRGTPPFPTHAWMVFESFVATATPPTTPAAKDADTIAVTARERRIRFPFAATTVRCWSFIGVPLLLMPPTPGTLGNQSTLFLRALNHMIVGRKTQVPGDAPTTDLAVPVRSQQRLERSGLGRWAQRSERRRDRHREPRVSPDGARFSDRPAKRHTVEPGRVGTGIEP